MRGYIWFFTFSIALLVSAGAQAYSNFIGYGYTSCINCHYNAFGTGPLTDYGRGLWASEIAGRALYSSKTTEEDLSGASGFLGTTPMPKWFRPSLAYRGLYLTQSVGNSPQSRYITMQGDFMGVLKFGKRDDVAIVGSIGYLPTPRTGGAGAGLTAGSNLISREHYLRVALSKKFYVYGGLMDKVYGLRVPDHIAFSRERTGIAQNDQTHGVVIYYNDKPWEGGLHVFAGNLFQEAPLRQKGVSALFEIEPAEKVRMGASALFSQNEFVRYTMGSLLTRVGVGHGSSVIAELGAISSTPNRQNTTLGLYGFMQSLFRVGGGFHFLTTFEYFTNDIQRTETRQFRFTPGFMYFPVQRVEIRIEAMNSRTYDPNAVRRDTWDLLSQLHLHF